MNRKVWSNLAVKYGATKAAQMLARRGAPPSFEEVYIAMIGAVGELRFVIALQESGDMECAWRARLNVSLDETIKAEIERLLLAKGRPSDLAQGRVAIPDLPPEVRTAFDSMVTETKDPWAVYWIRRHCSDMHPVFKRECDQILSEAKDSKWKWFAKDIPDFENVA